MSQKSRHAEWLSLIEVSGPFLSVTVLEKVFPQGLARIETPCFQQLRQTYYAWQEAVDTNDPQLDKLHQLWLQMVLTTLLEYDEESLFTAEKWQGTLPSITSQSQQHQFQPDLLVASPIDNKPRLFIALLPPETELTSTNQSDSWPLPLHERMTQLCRAHDLRLGLITNGERWMLVNAPTGSTSSYISWYSRLWFQDPLTLQAFQTLLGVRRSLGAESERLEAMLEESLQYQEEVTDTLGEQVKQAVEVLVQSLDKADEDRNRELLQGVAPSGLYEAGLTIMMRLVFILCAEERELLLCGDPLYDNNYAISTLRGQLSDEADQHGAEVLERRHDAWARLLALFRAVYGGIAHESLRMPALGGSLFDPDRFPFLEGRAKDTNWQKTHATPLPIDNRTVLLLLNALQLLEQPGGALLLSYRALDVEQIGHVYEGLLEHTVARTREITLGLQGTKNSKNPNLSLLELETAHATSEAAVVKLVREATGRSISAIRRALNQPPDENLLSPIVGLCGGNTALVERLTPYANLLRTDAWGSPIIYHANAFMVTLGADRRETGTHYTPKSLTEKIVTTTLEPVVYRGPATGAPREKWQLRSPAELLELKICDPAMGSGAFLVQCCRYLAERLVEAWLQSEKAGKQITIDGSVVDNLDGAEPMPAPLDDRLTLARRLISERCLYGVDINPLAVELAKLSIWLITLAKDRPFGFLDHNLRSGDSLLGIHQLQQLTQLTIEIKPDKPQQTHLFGQNIKAAVNLAIEKRNEIRQIAIRDIRDIQAKAVIEAESQSILTTVKVVANSLIGEVLAASGNQKSLEGALAHLSTLAGEAVKGDSDALDALQQSAIVNLSLDQDSGKPARRPFHWPLEFPEVFQTANPGFDAMVGNPPFVGGQRITGILGTIFRNWLVEYLADGRRGSADLVAYFFLRAWRLIRSDGNFGFLAVNTIAEGDTRQVGLEAMLNNGAIIYTAWPNEPWPGKAAVVTSRIHIHKGKWQGECTLLA